MTRSLASVVSTYTEDVEVPGTGTTPWKSVSLFVIPQKKRQPSLPSAEQTVSSTLPASALFVD